MLKFALFIIFILFAGCTSIPKKEIGTCEKNAPLVTSEKSAELKDRVVDAITRGDVQMTKSLASCNFIIEPGDAPDGAYYVRSSQAAPVLVSKLKGRHWSESFKDQDGFQHEVETEDGKYVLFFRRTNRDAGPWYWAGYLSLDTDCLDVSDLTAPLLTSAI